MEKYLYELWTEAPSVSSDAQTTSIVQPAKTRTEPVTSHVQNKNKKGKTDGLTSFLKKHQQPLWKMDFFATFLWTSLIHELIFHSCESERDYREGGGL